MDAAAGIDSDTQQWIVATRNELAVFLSLDSLTASPSVIAHLEDTRTEKEVAFALDHIITSLNSADKSGTL